MRVVRFSSLEELQAHAEAWNRLAANVPFRSWTWLSNWWRHYSAVGQLYVLAAFEGKRLVGIAPWYHTTTARQGRTIRFLGDGEVCSEYPTLLCQRRAEDGVTAAFAEWLRKAQGRDSWDVVELAPVETLDSAPYVLARRLAEAGCGLHRRVGDGCWRVTLPATWDEYLKLLSKDRRKKLRRMQRHYLDSGLARWYTASTPNELVRAEAILVDLHQKRRNMLGQPGCYASPAFRAFHRAVLPRLLQESRLGLHWLELEGRPIAAEYQLLGSEAIYCYQGGIEPAAADVSPGQIATLCTFRTAIERGYRRIDFLRGNESYKQRWRARCTPTEELRIVADRTTSQLRHVIWLAGVDAKNWLKGAMGAVSLRRANVREELIQGH